MFGSDLFAPGAKGSSKLADMHGMVAGSTGLSSEEVNNFHSYELSTCKRIQELISLIKNTTREPLTSDVLGCKTQLLSEKLSHVEQSHEQAWLLRERSLDLREQSLKLREQSLDLREQGLRLREQSLDLRECSTESSTKMEQSWVENEQVSCRSQVEEKIIADQLSSVQLTDKQVQQCDKSQSSHNQAHTDSWPAEGEREDPVVSLRIPSEPRDTISSQDTPTDGVPDLITWDDIQVPPPRCKGRKGGPASKCAPPFTLRPTAQCPRDEVLHSKHRQSHSQAVSSPNSCEPSPAGQKHVSNSSQPHFDPPFPCHQRANYFPWYRHHQYQENSGESQGPGRLHGQGLRFRYLESLASDIEHFDPDDPGSNIENYLCEVEHCLRDLPHASSREKVKLLWKTTTRSVRVFMKSLPPENRDSYEALCQALREEYSSYTDWASATLAASSIKHQKSEPPKKYYWRLRAAFFQGRSTPGLEEDHTFKSLFLHNLHESVRFNVTIYCRTRNLNMQEMREYAQLAWETQRSPAAGSESGPESDSLEFEGREVPHSKTGTKVRSKRRRRCRSSASLQSQGGAGPEMEDIISTFLAKALSQLHGPSHPAAASNPLED